MINKYFYLHLYIILGPYVMAQKSPNQYSHQMNKKLESLSGFVNEIAVKKKTGNYFKSGTGLFVKHKSDYYIVTAKHCFINGSTQVEYTVPTIENTNDEAAFFTTKDSLGNIKLLHSQKLHDGLQILFKVYSISDTQAIDVATLKLTNPSDEVKRLSINSDYFDNSSKISDLDHLIITGFPSYFENTEDSIYTSFAPNEIQELLDHNSKYYFLMPSNKDLRKISLAGFSGAAILNKDKQKIIGFVAGENKKVSMIYGIYAKYMYECLKNFSN